MFANRVEAGQRLAEQLRHLQDEPVVVFGLPRGGVPVAGEVAAVLDAPLDVLVVRKLGVPSRPELGMGAIGEDGVRVIDNATVRDLRITTAQLEQVERRERAELERRSDRYRGARPPFEVRERVALIVDDGIAMGSTARAACEVACVRGAARIVLAVPVAPPGWKDQFADVADDHVCVAEPEPFGAIGRFYTDFSQTTDDEVIEALQRAASRHPPPGSSD